MVKIPGSAEQPHGYKRHLQRGAKATIHPGSRATPKDSQKEGLGNSPEIWKQEVETYPQMEQHNSHFCAAIFLGPPT